jgi:hypothetical protein
MTGGLIDRLASSRLTLPAILLAAVLLRVAAWIVLAPPLESDGLSYVTMARNLAEHGVLRDNFGQSIFYSAGYPLLLTPAFAFAGHSLGVVLTVNLVLTLLSGLLLYRLATALGGPSGAALLAVAVFAAWLPAIWNAAMPAKENLSTPLLLGLLLSSLALARAPHVLLPALAAGLCWGAGAVTGGSAIIAGAAVTVALFYMLRDRRGPDAARAVLAFGLGAALTLGPWLYASNRMVGEPMLSSNAEFNLYLGNNPAATGRFVSIAATPAGGQWEAKRQELGEAGAAHWLGDSAKAWIAENPGEAARLAAAKLLLFWLPNIPDARDFAGSKAVSLIRLGDVAQYCTILFLAVCGLARSAIPARDRLILAALVGGFWAIHAAAYVMPRYRDPIAPVLIALAACWLWPVLIRRAAPRVAHAA